MQLRIIKQYDLKGIEVEILQYRDMDKWVDGSTTGNGRWVPGEWKDVPNLGWVNE